MKRLFYVFDEACGGEEVRAGLEALQTAFDDFEADASQVMCYAGAEALAGVENAVLETAPAVSGTVVPGALAMIDADALEQFAAQDDARAELEQASAILVDAGDLSALAIGDVRALAEHIVAGVPASMLGKCVVLWSGSDAEKMAQELFVMGRLAAVRIALAQAVDGVADEEPLVYYAAEGDAKLASALAEDGMFDGLYCANAAWRPAKFAALAQRVAEQS